MTFKENDYTSTIRYRKNVDEAGKRAALSVFEKWKSDDPKYNLLATGGKNCNSLAKEVAEALKLKISAAAPATAFHVNYIQRLNDAN